MSTPGSSSGVGPATNRGRPVPRHPGRISWESWSVFVGMVNPPRSRQEGMMRRWATALRQAAYDPSDTGQGSASSTTPLGLHLDYSMEFRSRRVGDIPPALTSSLLPSFPFWRSPGPGNLRHLLQLNSWRQLTVRSPHYLTKRVRWISSLTDKRC